MKRRSKITWICDFCLREEERNANPGRGMTAPKGWTERCFPSFVVEPQGHLPVADKSILCPDCRGRVNRAESLAKRAGERAERQARQQTLDEELWKHFNEVRSAVDQLASLAADEQ